MLNQSLKCALITGINGQDGSLMAELLLNEGYYVVGISRSENYSSNLKHLTSHQNLKFVRGSITDVNLVSFLLKEFRFDEIYNFASQSNVRYSYDNIYETFDSTLMGYVNLIESMNKYSKGTKLFQSVTSAIYGKTLSEDGYVDENSPFYPVSPYASAKLFTYNLGINFRENNNLKIINGILFNHESPKLKMQLGILATIVKKAIEIEKEHIFSWHIPNIETEVDISDANSVVQVIYQLMQTEVYSDFIICSGQNYSIRELCEMVFSKIGLNYNDYITYDDDHRVKNAIGDSSRIKGLGIFLNSDLDNLIDCLIDNERYSK